MNAHATVTIDSEAVRARIELRRTMRGLTSVARMAPRDAPLTINAGFWLDVMDELDAAISEAADFERYKRRIDAIFLNDTLRDNEDDQ